MDETSAVLWILGKLIILALTILLMAATCYWTFSEKQGILYELNKWPQESKYLIVTTYFYLISSYFLTMLIVTYIFQSPFLLDQMAFYPKKIVIISLILMTILTAMLECVPYSSKASAIKILLWAIHSMTMGPSLAYFGTYITTQATIKVSLATILATIIAFTAPKDTFEKIKQELEVLYSLVTFTSFLCFLFTPPINTAAIILVTFNLYGGIALYFGVFITNAQYLMTQVNKREYDPVYTAAVMYLSTLNMYLRVAMFYVIELTNITHHYNDIIVQSPL